MKIYTRSWELESTETSLFGKVIMFQKLSGTEEFSEFEKELENYKAEAVYMDPCEREMYAKALYNYRWELMFSYYNRMGGHTGDPEFDDFMAEAIEVAEFEEATGLG